MEPDTATASQDLRWPCSWPALVLLVLQWERPVGDLRMLFWGVPAAAVLYGALGTLTFRSPLLARLGEWSYALYLTHVFVITLYIKRIISAVTTIELPWQVHTT